MNTQRQRKTKQYTTFSSRVCLTDWLRVEALEIKHLLVTWYLASVIRKRPNQMDSLKYNMS